MTESAQIPIAIPTIWIRRSREWFATGLAVAKIKIMQINCINTRMRALILSAVKFPAFCLRHIPRLPLSCPQKENSTIFLVNVERIGINDYGLTGYLLTFAFLI
jgi:hypothetical protein